MIATAVKDGKCVRLSADYDIEKATAKYSVYCCGITFTFTAFEPAAKLYRTLVADMDEGRDLKDRMLRLEPAMIALGGAVRTKEVA